MNNIKTNTIPNARKIIKDALISFYQERGIKPRDDFFKPGLDALKLTKQQLAERQSNGVYAKYRALTGTIINELVRAKKIEVKEALENNRQQTPRVASTPKAKQQKPVQAPTTLNQRKKILIQTISDRYLTLDEQKSGEKINKLKAFVNDKRQVKYLELEDFEQVISYVDKWFVKANKLDLAVTQQTKKAYPSTDIGNCLYKQHQIYLRYLNRDIKQSKYQQELENTLIQAIKILGGAFFEKLSLEVIKNVYGARVVANSDKLNGGPSDHGIDAELKIQDEFGMQDTVFIQSKLSEKGEKVIREFIGAMTIENGHKGIFMAAESISGPTRRYFESRNRARRVSLIGREELIELMIKHSVGVKTENNKLVIDDDYFLSE